MKPERRDGSFRHRKALSGLWSLRIDRLGEDDRGIAAAAEVCFDDVH